MSTTDIEYTGRPGRPKGSLNKATRELKEYWDRFFKSPEYRESAKRRILAGTAAHLESFLLTKTYGKPREEISLHINPIEDELSSMSLDELTEYAERVAAQVKDAAECNDALPAEYKLNKDETSVRPQEPPAENVA